MSYENPTSITYYLSLPIIELLIISDHCVLSCLLNQTYRLRSLDMKFERFCFLIICTVSRTFLATA